MEPPSESLLYERVKAAAAGRLPALSDAQLRACCARGSDVPSVGGAGATRGIPADPEGANLTGITTTWLSWAALDGMTTAGRLDAVKRAILDEASGAATNRLRPWGGEAEDGATPRPPEAKRRKTAKATSRLPSRAVIDDTEGWSDVEVVRAELGNPLVRVYDANEALESVGSNRDAITHLQKEMDADVMDLPLARYAPVYLHLKSMDPACRFDLSDEFLWDAMEPPDSCRAFAETLVREATGIPSWAVAHVEAKMLSDVHAHLDAWHAGTNAHLQKMHETCVQVARQVHEAPRPECPERVSVSLIERPVPLSFKVLIHGEKVISDCAIVDLYSPTASPETYAARLVADLKIQPEGSSREAEAVGAVSLGMRVAADIAVRTPVECDGTQQAVRILEGRVAGVSDERGEDELVCVRPASAVGRGGAGHAGGGEVPTSSEVPEVRRPSEAWEGWECKVESVSKVAPLMRLARKAAMGED